VAEHVDRDALGAYLQSRGVESRVYFPPIHLQPYYRTRYGYREGAYPVSEAAGRTALALPFFNNMTEADVEHVAGVLKEGVHICAKG
jgi:perosamine synthetase